MNLSDRLRLAVTGTTAKPPFPVKQVKATEVKVGMILGPTRQMGVEPDKNGRWPVVTRAEYKEHGEGGEPTVYIMSDDDEDGCWPADPGDMVTVAADRVLSVAEFAKVLRDTQRRGAN